jgi:tRNA pseudouridine13 synthase
MYSLDFPFAYGGPLGEARFRTEPEDFQVEEELGFEPAGEGEHLYLFIEKRNQNTRWVAKQLADLTGVEEHAVGYCGLKDRRAVTRQWFSIHTPGQLASLLSGENIGSSEEERITILKSSRHSRKLRRGMHGGNRFVIRLREFTADREAVEQRLIKVGRQGVPNYFGEQRFGIDGGNLAEADRILSELAERNNNDHSAQNRGRRQGRKGRKPRQTRGGIYLSAARSYLFNLVLAQRVNAGSWHQPIDEETIAEGPLWGRGRSSAPASVRVFEERCLADWQAWCTGLEFSGLQQERRVLTLIPVGLQWQWQESDLILSFELLPGSYATALLRELAVLRVG